MPDRTRVQVLKLAALFVVFLIRASHDFQPRFALKIL